MDGTVNVRIYGAVYDPEINQSPVQVLLHKSSISAENMVVDVGVLFLYAFGSPCKDPDHIRFASTNIDVSGNDFIG